MEGSNVIAIVQARMGSTRLPGKVLEDLAGEPVLTRCINRVRRSEKLDEVVIATTCKQEDEAIVHLCTEHGWPCFRGSEEDVLDRYYQAALSYKAEVVVRITSDCPLIDPEVVDWLIQEFLDRQPGLDYTSNTLPPRTYPRGLDTEVIGFNALERAWQEDRNRSWREHVTPYIYRNPERFRIYSVTSETDYSSLRWTVDTPEDLAFVRCVYDHFGHDSFSWREVLGFLESNPELLQINRQVHQKVI
jgi:spore coat polysaccharide biosynthesis protein SpsF